MIATFVTMLAQHGYGHKVNNGGQDSVGKWQFINRHIASFYEYHLNPSDQKKANLVKLYRATVKNVKVFAVYGDEPFEDNMGNVVDARWNTEKKQIEYDGEWFDKKIRSNEFPLRAIAHETWRAAAATNPDVVDDDVYELSSELGFLDNLEDLQKKLVQIRLREARIRDINMEFKKIEGGKFLIGSPETEDPRWDDEKQHPVTVEKDYWIQTTPVTQWQWFQIMGTNPSKFNKPKNCPKSKTVGDVQLCPNNPVERVSWNDVKEFIAKLNEINEGHFRLPSEAQWEKAARGGRRGKFLGRDSIDNYAWHGKNSSDTTHPVGALKPNKYGLYDVLGNVSEWVEDKYGDDPLFTDNERDLVFYGDYRMVRGCNFNSDPIRMCRLARRGHRRAKQGSGAIGFRLVRTEDN